MSPSLTVIHYLTLLILPLVYLVQLSFLGWISIGILPDSYGRRRYSQDSYRHPFWDVGVPTPTFRANERMEHVPEDDGPAPR